MTEEEGSLSGVGNRAFNAYGQAMAEDFVDDFDREACERVPWSGETFIG